MPSGEVFGPAAPARFWLQVLRAGGRAEEGRSAEVAMPLRWAGKSSAGPGLGDRSARHVHMWHQISDHYSVLAVVTKGQRAQFTHGYRTLQGRLAVEARFSHLKALQALGYNQHPQPLSARVFTPQDGRAEAKGLEGKARQVTKKKGQGKQFLQRNSTETHFLGSHQAHGPPQAVGTGGRDRRRTRPRQPAQPSFLSWDMDDQGLRGQEPLHDALIPEGSKP